MAEITETQLKLRDAGIQMKLALRNSRDEDVLRSCINAFIGAARSITMTMERESKNHSEELFGWYKEQTALLAVDPLSRFFNAKRVHTIHRGVVRPASSQIKMSGYRESWVPDERAGLKKQMDVTIDKKDMPTPILRRGDVLHTMGPDLSICWTFPEAAEYLPDRSTNVFRLCEDHFVRLKTLVHAWLARRGELDKGKV